MRRVYTASNHQEKVIYANRNCDSASSKQLQSGKQWGWKNGRPPIFLKLKVTLMLNACNLKRKEEKWFPFRYNLKKTADFLSTQNFEAKTVSAVGIKQTWGGWCAPTVQAFRCKNHQLKLKESIWLNLLCWRFSGFQYFCSLKALDHGYSTTF